MKLRKFALGLTALALTVMMASTARACVGPGLSPGFWKHNVGVYLGLENGAYSDPGYTDGRVSKDTMGDWLHANWDDATLLALFNDLSTRGGGAAGAAIRVAAANVFNTAADLYPYVQIRNRKQWNTFASLFFFFFGASENNETEKKSEGQVLARAANEAYSSPGVPFDMPGFLDGFTLAYLQNAYAVLSTGGGGAVAQARLDMANVFNAAAGSLPYSD